MGQYAFGQSDCRIHKNSKKTENIFNNYWVGMVKYGLGLLGHGTLKSALSQESFNESS